MNLLHCGAFAMAAETLRGFLWLVWWMLTSPDHDGVFR